MLEFSVSFVAYQKLYKRSWSILLQALPFFGILQKLAMVDSSSTIEQELVIKAYVVVWIGFWLRSTPRQYPYLVLFFWVLVPYNCFETKAKIIIIFLFLMYRYLSSSSGFSIFHILNKI